MNISDRDLLKLRRDIERVRKHEEIRRADKTDEEEPELADQTPIEQRGQGQFISISVRLRQMLAAMLTPPRPSSESLEAIPEHVVTLLQVIKEEPKFERWLLAIAALPAPQRNQQLAKMSFAIRVDDADSTIASSFDRLQERSLFHAFCRALREAAGPRLL